MKLNRREFIQKLGVGVAGVGAVSLGLNPFVDTTEAKPEAKPAPKHYSPLFSSKTGKMLPNQKKITYSNGDTGYIVLP